MVRIAFGPVESAELAVNIAHVRVIDVPIDDVGDDLTSAAVITLLFRLVPTDIGQSAELFQWPPVEFQTLVDRDPFPGKNPFRQSFTVQ